MPSSLKKMWNKLLALLIDRILRAIIDYVEDWILFQKKKKILKDKIKEIKASGKPPTDIAANIDSLLS